MTYTEAKTKISQLLIQNPNGPFTHNIISMNLISLAKTEGKEKANELIDELDLPYQKS